MDYVLVVFVGVIGVLLVAILLELRTLRGALGKWSVGRGFPEAKAKEGSQTVTVNVGALVSPEKTSVTAPVVEETIEAEDESETEPPPTPVKQAPRSESSFSRTASGGLGIVKCPQCSAENTSFRSECFRCGKALR